MNMLRLMVAVLGLSAAMSSGLQARKAGAGARAGLPNLFKELNLSANATSDNVMMAVMDKLGHAFLKNDTNTARKVKDSFRVLIQKRPLWQNLGLTGKKDLQNAQLLGMRFSSKMDDLKKAMNIKKEADRSPNKSAIAGVKALDTTISIVAQEYSRQIAEWLKNNPAKKADFMRGADVRSLSEFDFSVKKGSESAGSGQVERPVFDDEDDDEFVYGKPSDTFNQEFEEDDFRVDDPDLWEDTGQVEKAAFANLPIGRDAVEVGQDYFTFMGLQNNKDPFPLLAKTYAEANTELQRDYRDKLILDTIDYTLYQGLARYTKGAQDADNDAFQDYLPADKITGFYPL